MKLVKAIAAAYLAVAGTALAAPAEKPTHLLCKGDGDANVYVHLNSKKQFGHILSCISGPFISDMTPCAPNGGYGLSASTGSAALVGVVMRSQEYQRHLGGVTGFNRQGDDVTFTGGFMGSNGLQTAWTLKLDPEGNAVVRDQEGSTPYKCKPYIPSDFK
ncbi:MULTISPECIES: hypothetical protein [unclassified Rhizobium]|uniref:hypothetical protein n=1 Tax=unclassified Rhizobium TaxID=2613769 RepID=UPI000EA8652F|nr:MULTISPECIES: hypothetical protein [unclassified Rhizobium]AYG65114.1 hypothetical protein CCGE531_03260 [Rhizobium sp. CCGE531]AYG71598.1 hypothetical protein CCGE532_03250 [Rhizobium sp. CCGE532]